MKIINANGGALVDAIGVPEDQLREAARLLNIHVTDHVVISRNSYYSYQEEGRL